MYEELKDGLYENSFYAKEDYLLEQINRDGDVDAMFLLATLYFDNGMMSDAYKWFCKAAEHGQADAIYYIGNYYYRSDGYNIVEPSKEKAIEYYFKAAEMGSPYAMCTLACRYRQGTVELEQNTEKAIDLFEKAAELGYHKAFFDLAVCYKNGLGVEKDLKKAFDYAEEAYYKAWSEIEL